MLRTRASHASRQRLAQNIAAIAAAAGALFPTVAHAEDWSGGVGAFVGYAFGAHQGFEWGFEGFATKITEGGSTCSSQERAGFGPLAQFSLIGLGDPRLTLAALGGKELNRKSLTSLTGEFGMTYRWGNDPGPGVHLGLLPSFFIVNAYGRAEILLDDYSFGGGLRILPPFGLTTSVCVTGRPLRTDTSLAPIQGHGRRKRPSRATCGADANRLQAGHAWERDAQYECASVPAFLDLARALLACGAPENLVRRALAAACDEIIHARQCADVASRLLGESIVPTLPDTPTRAPLAGQDGLVRLAVESWIDGCLGEGASARQAERAAEVANHELAPICASIASDEARHAELGWDVLRWALGAGGSLVREAVRSHREVEAPTVNSSDAPIGLEPLGRLSSEGISESMEQNLIASRRRLDHILF
jgi:hypothetical protein